MIIVQIIGGLGNQMFQYALGRRLADGLDVHLKLDITPFRSYALRRYSLCALNIREELATDREVARARAGRLPRVRKLLHRVLPSVPTESPRLVRERTRGFDPAILDAPDGSYLEGYWQSEKYFDVSAERLRVEFSPHSPLSGQDAAVAERMREGDAVSVHVRRGDYVSDPVTSKVHGVCDEAYYARCVDYLAERLEDPRFFVFSDEPEWARENLRIPFPTTVVDHNKGSLDFEDLRLMSICRHHIIANSSFSWWGAWLNPEPSKIVLMPQRWFFDREPEYAADIRPAGWVAL